MPWCAGHITSSMESEELSLSGEGSSYHQEFLMLVSTIQRRTRYNEICTR